MSAIDLDSLKWLVILGVLGIVEVAALVDARRGDTLSEAVWRWFRVHDRMPHPLAYVARGMLLIFLVWLTGHLVFGWWSF